MGKKYVIEVEKSNFKLSNGEYYWRINGINIHIPQSDLEKLEEYKEPQKHVFEPGDMCRWKEVLFTRNNEVFITRITGEYVEYLDKMGNLGSMLRGVFETSADFVYHANLFESLSEE